MIPTIRGRRDLDRRGCVRLAGSAEQDFGKLLLPLQRCPEELMQAHGVRAVQVGRRQPVPANAARNVLGSGGLF